MPAMKKLVGITIVAAVVIPNFTMFARTSYDALPVASALRVHPVKSSFGGGPKYRSSTSTRRGNP